MSIPSGDLYQLARVRYEDRQSEASRRLAEKQLRGEPSKRGADRLRSFLVFVGMALLPLGESLSKSVSERRSLDVPTQ